MRGGFRFAPPAAHVHALTRPRLLRVLLERWDHRLTLVVGGPGFGKTTLLLQAEAENRLAPRGRDIWFGLEPRDASGARLGADLVEAIGASEGSDPIDAVAAAVWSLAPTPVCLILDDAHHLPGGSEGLRLVDDLLAALPGNGHVLMSSRTRPPVKLGRLAAAGQLTEVGEDDLRLTDDELHEFARLRSVDPSRLQSSGGWPALAELTVTASERVSGDFVWEEVLEPLGQSGRELMAVLIDLGSADSALVSAALDTSIDLSTALQGVPLVTRDWAGWYQPHRLWHSVTVLHLPPNQRVEIRRRAVRHLVAVHRFEDAFDLLAEISLWDLAPDVLRGACLAGARPVAGQLDEWLRRSPAEVQQTPAGLLARGVVAEMSDSSHADAPLRAAMVGFRDAADLEGEVAALTHFGRVAWWRQDVATLASLVPRVAELAATGHPAAMLLHRVGQAFALDLKGDDEGIWRALDGLSGPSGDPWWDAVVAWLRSLVVMSRGDANGCLAILDSIGPLDDPVFGLVLESARALARWALGHVDSVAAGEAELVTSVETTGVAQNIALNAAFAALCLSHLGDGEAANKFLVRALDALPGAQGIAVVRCHLAEASMLLTLGDESGSANIIRTTMATHSLERATPRRAWRECLALSYILVPETRPVWDTAALDGHHDLARSLARTVVASRERAVAPPAELPPLVDLGVVRGILHFRLAAELSVYLHPQRRSEAAALLEAIGPSGREVVRELARGRSASAATARRLLAAVPARPSIPVHIAAFGPLMLWRAGAPVDEPALRRERVRSLLAFLLIHRSTHRQDVVAALWPDFDTRAAANNLRVTLSHLIGVLEPNRTESEPSYYVRAEGDRLRLVTQGASIDIDAFEDDLRTARAAERDAAPSIALDHYRRAADTYRGALFADLSDSEWFSHDRDRYRLRFLEAAVRAAELLVAAGQPEAAELLAERALGCDQWSESACCVLVTAALARGQRSAARHHLDRCLAIAADLGVEPCAETARLQRQLRGQSPPAPNMRSAASTQERT